MTIVIVRYENSHEKVEKRRRRKKAKADRGTPAEKNVPKARKALCRKGVAQLHGGVKALRLRSCPRQGGAAAHLCVGCPPLKLVMPQKSDAPARVTRGLKSDRPCASACA